MTAQTLMLDQSYQPVKVIPWERAITLLSLGKIEIIEEYDKELRSTFLVIKMPAVVRLLSKFKRYKKPVKFSRVNVYARDNYQCQYCGKSKKMRDLTYDHVIPRARGGRTTWENIVSACEPCNTKKSHMTLKRADMTLIQKPVRPKWLPAITIRVSKKSVPQAWRDYLWWTCSLDED